MADPYIDYVRLLLHCDGANNGTVFTDSTGLTAVTAVGWAVTSTDQSKFGQSVKFGASNSYLEIPSTAALKFGASDFTLELWCYKTANNADASRLWNGNGDVFVDVSIGIDAVGTLCTYGSTNGSAWNAWSLPSCGTVPANAWAHIALTRAGSTVRAFINGVQTASATFSGTLFADSFARVIGGQAGLNRQFYGYIDEVRITKGIARYTADFTPPDAPFDNPQPPITHGFLALLGRQNNEVPNALLAQPSAYNRAAVLGWRNIYQGGAGRVSGTVKYTPNSPVHRKVRLIEQATGMLIREAWSDPITGAYSFDYVDPTCKYTVLSHDYTGAYRAVVADGIIPEAMP